MEVAHKNFGREAEQNPFHFNASFDADAISFESKPRLVNTRENTKHIAR